MTTPIEIKTAGGGCGCCGHDAEAPVLDVRPIPHAIRHATVFGAFDAIAPGQALVLVAPHNPLPLLGQLAERARIDVQNIRYSGRPMSGSSWVRSHVVVTR